MKIYDYDNKFSEVDTNNKEIDRIHVTILSGDELVTVYFSDGTKISADSSDCRIHSFYDGEYDVEKSKVNDWINFKFSGKQTNSYERAGHDWGSDA